MADIPTAAEVAAIRERVRDIGVVVEDADLVLCLCDDVDALRADNERLRALIDCPHNDDWFNGTRIEAAHQIERWGASHDSGKEPEDWFWLVGYLAGKCLRACIDGDTEKAKHHTISTAAVLLNWYRRISGEDESMRPGIDAASAALAR